MAEISPLQALADSTLTTRQIRKRLKRIADACVDYGLKEFINEPSIRATVEKAVEGYLDLHYFSGFSRKQSIDKTVSNAMRGYKSRLLSAMREELKRLKKEGLDWAPTSWVNNGLQYPNPGREWDNFTWLMNHHQFSTQDAIDYLFSTIGLKLR